MIQTVVKRDGRIVGFNEEKIKAAIRKAMMSTEAGEDDALLCQIADRIAYKGKEQMSVEEIQDLVELELMKSSRKDVAKRYIAYVYFKDGTKKEDIENYKTLWRNKNKTTAIKKKIIKGVITLFFMYNTSS